jgi:hypothetical protein
MRKRFNAAERAALKGPCEVRDGRTWYPFVPRASDKITTDTLGTECVVILPRTIGKGTCAIYPGNVR